MKRLLLAATLIVLLPSVASADDRTPVVHGQTTDDGVRVTVIKVGGVFSVGAVSGTGGSGGQEPCVWSVVTPTLNDAPYGSSAGAQPSPEHRFALLLCNGNLVREIWVAPADIVDVDAIATAEVERFVRDVLMPDVTIGVNPDASGLAGLRSWFWIEGFDGSVEAPTINAFGLSIDVRMTSEQVTWGFGDGTTLDGDLGLAYPAESTVQHAHRDAGAYDITATLHLVPEYRVDGGPWITLPNLEPTATAAFDVEEREAVLQSD